MSSLNSTTRIIGALGVSFLILLVLPTAGVHPAELRFTAEPDTSRTDEGRTPLLNPIDAMSEVYDTLEWGSPVTHDFVSGLLTDLSTYGTTASGQVVGPAPSFSIAGDQPAAGTGLWYLFRDSGTLGEGATGHCSAPPITWGGASRDAALP